ncbi:MAG TPA: diacylglycerol kinase family protein [Lachnospiraceae bacterium]|nr:diacylglycerol kinase family protein [Lachnospiraceae bacterium]
MYYFIINPKSKSGSGIKIWNVVKKELGKRKVRYCAYFTHYEAHATKIAAQICMEHSNQKTIVVVGGDGSVNEVINGIMDYSSVILGYIPSGSSNDLARSLGIPSNPIRALNHILSMKDIQYIDHGVIRFLDLKKSRKFAVSSGLGFDASICLEALTSNIKKVLNTFGLGKLTYIVIALKQMIRHKPTDVKIVIDGRKTLYYRNVLFVANMIHKCEGGGLILAPKANYQDRRITTCVIHDIPKLKALLLLSTVFKGKHIKYKGVDIVEGNQLLITAKDKVIIHTDGEFCGHSKHMLVRCTDEQIRMIL